MASGSETVLAVLAGDSARQGRRLGAALTNTREAMEALRHAFCEIAWFQAPHGDDLSNELTTLATLANELSDALRACLDGKGSPERVWRARKEGDRVCQSLGEAIVPRHDEGPGAASLLPKLFRVDPAWQPVLPDLDVHGLRAASALSLDELNALGAAVAKHLVPEGAAWMPPPTRALLAVLVADRPLIAHRTALATRDVVVSSADRHGGAVASVLADYRRQGIRELAAHREIVMKLEAAVVAEMRGDHEGHALAVAWLYAALADGPAHRAAITLLRLHGRDMGDRPKLGNVREALGTLRCCHAASAFEAALQPDWRNAIDHRELHWDPSASALVLRDALVSVHDLAARCQAATAATAGVELGITLAMAARPVVYREVERLAPKHLDRALVEYGLREELAGRGVTRAAVRTVADRLLVGPVHREDIVYVLAAMVGRAEDLRSMQAIELAAEGLPVLLVAPSALRRAGTLRCTDDRGGRVLPPDALLPVFVTALAAAGAEPLHALNLVVEKAIRDVDADVGSLRGMARRLAIAARRARRVVRVCHTEAGFQSPESTAVDSCLRELEAASNEFN